MRLLPGYVQFPGASRKCQTIGLKVAAARLPPIHASLPTPPPIVISSPPSSSECLEFYPWNTMAKEASDADRPPLRPPHFPVAYFRNGQQRNNYLRPFYFAKIDFLIPPFYCRPTLRKPGRRAGAAAIQASRGHPGKGLNVAGVKIRVGERTCMRVITELTVNSTTTRRPWRKAVVAGRDFDIESSLSSEP